jgi:hypothetical protein
MRAMGSQSAYAYNSLDKPEDFIHGVSQESRSGQNWSALMNIQGTKVATFTLGGKNCFAFASAGGTGYKMLGYQYLRRGSLCQVAGRPQFTNEQIERLIEKFEARTELPEIRTTAKPTSNSTLSKSVDPGGTSPQVSDFLAKLKALKDAYDQGLISSSEYETRQKAVLDAMAP